MRAGNSTRRPEFPSSTISKTVAHVDAKVFSSNKKNGNGNVEKGRMNSQTERERELKRESRACERVVARM